MYTKAVLALLYYQYVVLDVDNPGSRHVYMSLYSFLIGILTGVVASQLLYITNNIIIYLLFHYKYSGEFA